MAESAALLVDEVLPHEPIRQWVLSVPFPLRFLFASQSKVMGKALGIVYRTIATHLRKHDISSVVCYEKCGSMIDVCTALDDRELSGSKHPSF